MKARDELAQLISRHVRDFGPSLVHKELDRQLSVDDDRPVEAFHEEL